MREIRKFNLEGLSEKERKDFANSLEEELTRTYIASFLDEFYYSTKGHIIRIFPKRVQLKCAELHALKQYYGIGLIDLMIFGNVYANKKQIVNTISRIYAKEVLNYTPKRNKKIQE